MKGFLIDVQGTLIDDADKRAIPGSLEVIESLRKRGVPFMLVTNNTKMESAEFRGYLRGLGFDFSDEQYLDPLMVLESVLPPCRVAAYGTEPFLRVLRERGYRLEYDSPEAVLVSIKEDFGNDEFATMIEALLGGAALIGMHETSLYAKSGRRYPGVGAILKMLSFATGRDYEVVGKPSERFYSLALDMLREQGGSAEPGSVVMVSDDLTGDLKGAKEMGMRTALVLSGKIASADEVAEELERIEPEWVCGSVGEWYESYERGAA
ncbi:NagD, predicted sugar phosphatases of the HAD superfamily [Hydrogenimonas sp.]|nr:NagD, predicted sugar phosphatases of the HAD superfamily [Hydrogenimonas sp.]